MLNLILLPVLMFTQQPSFKEAQLKHARVKAAYEEKEHIIKQYFASQNLDYKGFHLFIRAFKNEQRLEVWIKEKDKDVFVLLTHYRFCSSSGTLGPKRKEGDLQIPEGIYYLNHFNPQSNFHLSLGVSYPNASDKILSDPKSPGSAIYIHGNCVTIGCIPVTDERIKELYVLAVEARSNGQKKIPIYIFPSKLDEPQMMELKEKFGSSVSLIRFWDNLRPVYADFEKTRMLKTISVNSRGEYHF